MSYVSAWVGEGLWWSLRTIEFSPLSKRWRWRGFCHHGNSMTCLCWCPHRHVSLVTDGCQTKFCSFNQSFFSLGVALEPQIESFLPELNDKHIQRGRCMRPIRMANVSQLSCEWTKNSLQFKCKSSSKECFIALYLQVAIDDPPLLNRHFWRRQLSQCFYSSHIKVCGLGVKSQPNMLTHTCTQIAFHSHSTICGFTISYLLAFVLVNLNPVCKTLCFFMVNLRRTVTWIVESVFPSTSGALRTSQV